MGPDQGNINLNNHVIRTTNHQVEWALLILLALGHRCWAMQWHLHVERPAQPPVLLPGQVGLRDLLLPGGEEWSVSAKSACESLSLLFQFEEFVALVMEPDCSIN